MNLQKICLTVLALALFVAMPAAAATAPTPDLEKKIAYQQGQFGALYARCGSKDEQIVIGGSLASWRKETFLKYNGTPQELAALQKTFDQAAADVAGDSESCQNWMKQAAATWRSIIRLSEYGTPVATATNP